MYCHYVLPNNPLQAFTERYKIHEQSSVCSNRPSWACDMGGMFLGCRLYVSPSTHLGYRPDVYFKPQEVWEIRGAE